jgi:hypothetical protein
MKLIPLKQAARETGVPYWRLRAWCHDGILEHEDHGVRGRSSFFTTLDWVANTRAHFHSPAVVPADDPAPTLRRSRVVTPAAPSVAETLRRIRDMHKRPSSAGR